MASGHCNIITDKEFNPVINKITNFSAKNEHNPKFSFLSIRKVWEDSRVAALFNNNN
jgi:hypothetical protein